MFISCNHARKEDIVRQSEISELKLKEFVTSLSLKSDNFIGHQIDSVLEKVSKDSVLFQKTINYLSIRLSDPNSIYRNETAYKILLKAQIQSRWYGEIEKAQLHLKLRLLNQNNVGTSANDFTYTTPSGFKKKMHDLKGNNVLLFFYNPECEACKDMKEVIKSSPIINKGLYGGQLKILAVYTDKDEEVWFDHLNEYPNTWIQGRDENECLYKNKIYDLKAIPTIYLLDSSKRVILKDCFSIEAIEKAITASHKN